MTKRVAVFGATGQVGRALIAALGSSAVSADRSIADFSAPQMLPILLDRLHAQEKLTAVINAAAYTSVDLAEKEEQLAFVLNAESPGALARWCAAHRVPLVHYSTDYVFSGEGQKPWTEEDPVHPINAYGRSKLAGEQSVRAAGGSFLILRTSWIYDAFGANFVLTMLRLGKSREAIDVVADQFGSPTYAPHLAHATLAALDHANSLSDFPSGVFHLCGTGVTSWHGFATTIFQYAKKNGIPLAVGQVSPVPSSAYPTLARRPLNSRLCADLAARVLGLRLPHWSEGLAECMALIKNT